MRARCGPLTPRSATTIGPPSQDWLWITRPISRTMLRVHRPARRLVQLYAGLVLYGASMALQIRAGLGLDPWDVFHQGVADRTGLSFGTVVAIIGALVLLAWIPLRQRPGAGTVSNVFVIAVAVDAALAVIPEAGTTPVALAML